MPSDTSECAILDNDVPGGIVNSILTLEEFAGEECEYGEQTSAACSASRKHYQCLPCKARDVLLRSKAKGAIKYSEGGNYEIRRSVK